MINTSSCLIKYLSSLSALKEFDGFPSHFHNTDLIYWWKYLLCINNNININIQTKCLFSLSLFVSFNLCVKFSKSDKALCKEILSWWSLGIFFSKSCNNNINCGNLCTGFISKPVKAKRSGEDACLS